MITSLVDLSATLGSERDALITATAGLQLLPHNATKWMRLQRLAEAALGADPSPNQKTTSPGRLRPLLTSPPVATAEILLQEDPFEDTFTAEVTFFGGSRRVILGEASGAHAACELLLRAVNSLPNDAPLSQYKAAVMNDADVLLRLSDVICLRAGLGRWEAPVAEKTSPLVIPSAAELGQLQAAVVFAPEDLASILGDLVVSLDRLTLQGSLHLVEHEDVSPTDGRVYLHPLARLTEGQTAAILPAGFATSIIHRALTRAVHDGFGDAVWEALHVALQRTLASFFDAVRWRPEPPPDLAPPDLVREVFYRFDVDKIAHVTSVVEPLDDLQLGDPFPVVRLSAVEQELNQRLPLVRSRLRSAMPHASVLHVVCLPKLGFTSALGFTHQAIDANSALLATTVDDLDIIIQREAPDPLGLWYFAQASDRLHQRCRVMSFSKLDEYSAYVGHGHGFYFGDDRPPDFLGLEVGTGSSLRCEQRQRSDMHAVAVQNGVVQVTRWDADDTAPIYRPLGGPRKTHRFVELPELFWVIPAPTTSEEEEASEDLVDAVAFWIWRCRPYLGPALEAMALSGEPLIVRARFVAQSIDELGSGAVHPRSDWLICEARRGAGEVELTLLDGAALRMRGPGNNAERVMADALVEAVYRAVGLDTPRGQHTIEGDLPDGPMKMIHVFGDEDHLMMTLGHAAQPRLVSSANVEVLLDEVGTIATEILSGNTEPVAADDRTDVLNAIVAELFQRLLRQLKGLEVEDLLESLAAEQEGLAFLEARNDLMVPAHAACFGEKSKAVQDLLGSGRPLAATAIASRFLIECVTAIGPSGDRPLSVGLYDRLIATAKQIVELGFLSDAVRYGLSSTELSLLPSGRLGTSRDEPYYRALDEYINIVSGRLLGNARRSFHRFWAAENRPTNTVDFRDLDRAFLAEFGFTAQELSMLSGELINLARGAPRQVLHMPSSDAAQSLAAGLSWPEDKVERALDLLTLGPLEQFPISQDRTDSYPWRFSRRRAFTRRPLLRRTTDHGDILVWGPRSVLRAGHYLLNQVLSARLDAVSDDMKRYITATRQLANRDFNRQVADLFRSEADLDVRENVKKVGRLRFARDNGQLIGDIDVLVIDRSHKVLLAVEAKDFEFARTPLELSNEVAKLLDGEGSALHHHLERLDFLRRQLSGVVRELGLPGRHGEWQVQGLIVTSHDLLAARFHQASREKGGGKVIPYADLAQSEPLALVRRRDPTRNTRADRRRRRRR